MGVSVTPVNMAVAEDFNYVQERKKEKKNLPEEERQRSDRKTTSYNRFPNSGKT